MDPLIAKPIITFITILIVMAIIPLLFLTPDAPEFWIDIISLLILLFMLSIVVYSIRRALKKR